MIDKFMSQLTPPKFSHRNFSPDLHRMQEQPWGLPNPRKFADPRNSHMPDFNVFKYRENIKRKKKLTQLNYYFHLDI